MKSKIFTLILLILCFFFNAHAQQSSNYGFTVNVPSVATSPVISADVNPVCAGGSAALSIASGNADWQWRTGSCGGPVIGTGTSITVSPSVTTTYYVSGNGTGTQSACAEVTITVIPSPEAGTITGIKTVCVNAATQLSNVTPGGIWSSSAPSVAAVDALSGIATGITEGPAVISYTVTNGMGCTTTVTETIGVKALPVVPAITGGASVCVNSGIQLSDALTGGQWASGSPSVAIINQTSGYLTGISEGSSVIVYTSPADVNGCVSNATASVTVNALPVVSPITGEVKLCSNVQLGNANAGGTWNSSTPAVASIDASGLVTGNSPGASVITYTSAVDANGCSNSVVTPITVNALPNLPEITGSRSVCLFSSTLLSNSIAGGTWASSDPSVATVDASGAVSGLAVGTTIITYTSPTDANGCSSTTTASVNVNPLPALGPISGPENVCVNSTIQLTNETSDGSWSVNSPGIATVDESGVVTGVAGGTVVVTYTGPPDANGCSNTVSISVLVKALPAVAPITGSYAMCLGSTVQLTSETSGGSWTSSNSVIALITSPSDLNSISVNGKAPGNAVISYEVTQDGCSSVLTYPMTVSSPTATFVRSLSTACQGSSSTVLTFTGFSGIMPYTFYFTLNGGATQSITTTSGNSAVLVVPTETVGLLSYTFTGMTDSIGCSKVYATKLTVMVNPTPSVLATPLDEQTICSGDSITPIAISNPNELAGTVLSWTKSNKTISTTIQSGSNPLAGTLINNANVQRQTFLTVRATLGSCSSSYNVLVNVNPRPSVAVVDDRDQTICSGSLIKQLSIINTNAVVGTTFDWSRDNTDNLSGLPSSGTEAIISGSFNNISNPLTPQTTTFTVRATSPEGCYSVVHYPNILVNPRPDVLITPSDMQSVCSGDSLVPITISNPNGLDGTVFTWTKSNKQLTMNIPANSNPIAGTFTNTINTQKVTLLNIKATLGSCSSTTSVTINVNPIPAVSVASSKNQTICSGSLITPLTINNWNNVAGSTLSWTRDNGDNITGIETSGNGASISGNLFNISNPLTQQTTTITATATSTEGCFATVKYPTITVNPLPDILVSPVDSQSICSGTSITPINISNPNGAEGAVISWTRTNTTSVKGIVANANPIEGVLTIVSSVPKTTVFSIKAAIGTCSSSATVTVNVNPAANCRVAGEGSGGQSSSGQSIDGINVYPNPAHDKLNVDFTTGIDGSYLIKMTDVTGRLVVEKTAVAPAGLNHIELDLSGLAKGIYDLSFISNTNSQQVRVVVE